MKTENSKFYRRMADYRRYMEGAYWPGKPEGAPAVTLYPNILEEMNGSGRYLWWFAQAANVSREVMAAVMEDGEELTPIEALSLARALDVAPGYIQSSVLQIVSPASHRGFNQCLKLIGLWYSAKGLELDYKYSIETTYKRLLSGEPVTYAAYRWACIRLSDAIEKARLPVGEPRGERLSVLRAQA